MEIFIPHTLPGDDTTVAISFTAEEVEALIAAGRAAGYSDLKSVLHGIIDDAIGIGCRVLRAEEDAALEREKETAEMTEYAEEITTEVLKKVGVQAA